MDGRNQPVTIAEPSGNVLIDSVSALAELVVPDVCVAQGMEGAAIAVLAPTPRLRITMVSNTNFSTQQRYTSGIVFSQIASCFCRYPRHSARNDERRPAGGVLSGRIPGNPSGRYWARTSDPRLVEAVLYQLS